MQGKVCGKKRHTKTEIRSEISELICGRIAAGENYNLTRDSMVILNKIGNVLTFIIRANIALHAVIISVSAISTILFLHSTNSFFVFEKFLKTCYRMQLLNFIGCRLEYYDFPMSDCIKHLTYSDIETLLRFAIFSICSLISSFSLSLSVISFLSYVGLPVLNSVPPFSVFHLLFWEV